MRSIYADHEYGDYSSTEWAHPEIELVIPDGPAPGRWTGLAGMREGVGDWLRAWEDFWVQVEEYRELDDERVLVLVRVSGRGKTSGLGVAGKGAALFQVRDGKVARVVTYFDRERALADLGIADA